MSYLNGDVILGIHFSNDALTLLDFTWLMTVSRMAENMEGRMGIRHLTKMEGLTGVISTGGDWFS